MFSKKITDLGNLSFYYKPSLKAINIDKIITTNDNTVLPIILPVITNLVKLSNILAMTA